MLCAISPSQPSPGLLAPQRGRPAENRGAFISINSTVLRLGQTLGPVLMSAAAIPIGLAGAYFAGAALAAAMFLVAFALIR